MKRFTIIFSILLVLGFAGTLAYVGMSPDFQEPAALAAEGEDPDAPVWGMGMDDMMDYLEEKGLWDRSSMLPLSEGVATEAYTCNNIELYWWDVDNLTEGSNEEAAYQDILTGEPINLYQQGMYYMNVTKNGPFAIFNNYYTGDVNELLDAFSSFGQTGGTAGASDRSAPVWSKTMDDMLAYMVEEGFLSSVDDAYPMSGGVGTEGKGFDGAEIYWWDVDNLEEGSDEANAYESANAEGIIDLWGQGFVMAVTPNGPFALAYANYSGDGNSLLAAFQAFGRE